MGCRARLGPHTLNTPTYVSRHCISAGYTLLLDDTTTIYWHNANHSSQIEGKARNFDQTTSDNLMGAIIRSITYEIVRPHST